MYLTTVAWLISMPSLRLSVNPRRAPQRVGGVHLPNQITSLAIHRRPSCSRTPAPKEAEALTVPLDDRCRLNQHHRIHTPRIRRWRVCYSTPCSDFSAWPQVSEGSRVTSPRREISRIGPNMSVSRPLRCPHYCGNPRTRANFAGFSEDHRLCGGGS